MAGLAAVRLLFAAETSSGRGSRTSEWVAADKVWCDVSFWRCRFMGRPTGGEPQKWPRICMGWWLLRMCYHLQDELIIGLWYRQMDEDED
jgi:hypothetical protein